MKQVACLLKARDAYYNGTPCMTDAAFDALEDELRAVSPDHWYFTLVGAAVPVDGAWPEVEHGIPMGSLAKSQNAEEALAWLSKVGSPAVVGSLKLDGISVSLRYDKRKLVQALTRGDGKVGSDITRNVLRMKGVVAQLKSLTGYVRGEIVCCRSDFAHLKGYANTRNSASGIARRQSNAEDCRWLTVMAYQVVPEKLLARKDMEMTALARAGFIVPPWRVLTPATFEQWFAAVTADRASYDFDIDGVVLDMVDQVAAREMGIASGKPRGARAVKFAHMEAETALCGITWQVGKSGRITPVAEFEPVMLAGAEVSRASLHNISNVKSLWVGEGPRGGDKIVVSRRNDVIPYVESVVCRADSDPLNPPTECPEPTCRSKLERDGEYLVCRNTDCRAQVAGAMRRWVEKIGVLHFGHGIIEAVVDAGMAEDIADLYELDMHKVAELTIGGRRIGRAADKARVNLAAQTVLPPAVFLGSLGIPGWGRSMCQKLVDAGFHVTPPPSQACLEGVEGVGAAKAAAFTKGYAARADLVNKLLVHITIKTAVGPLSGQSFCFTGFRDKALESAIEAAGGTVKGTVGKSLTYLVAADPSAESGKVAKAKKYGVSVIDRNTAGALVSQQGA